MKRLKDVKNASFIKKINNVESVFTSKTITIRIPPQDVGLLLARALCQLAYAESRVSSLRALIILVNHDVGIFNKSFTVSHRKIKSFIATKFIVTAIDTCKLISISLVRKERPRRDNKNPAEKGNPNNNYIGLGLCVSVSTNIHNMIKKTTQCKGEHRLPI